jgi:LPS export ABC transporter protein LptC
MKFRIYILVAVLGVSAIIAGWIYESRLRPVGEKAELAIPDNIDYFLTNMNYRAMTETGEPDFAFQSPRLEHYPVTDVSQIEVPSMQIYRAPAPWLVDARSGEFRHRENLLRLSNQVVMRREGEQPIQVHAERMRFELDTDLITSESDIVIESEESYIEAEHAVFDLANGVYSLRNAKTIYYNEKS